MCKGVINVKVLLVNGGPHQDGCTNRALKEVSKTLEENGIKTEIMWLGTKAISGCIACNACIKTGRCVIEDKVNEFLGKVKEIVIFFAVLCYNMAVHEREQFADKGLKGSVRIRRSADSVFVFGTGDVRIVRGFEISGNEWRKSV